VPDTEIAVVVYATILLSYVFGSVILVRAVHSGSLSRYAFFHSYLIYFLATGVARCAVWFWARQQYPVFFWINFVTLVIAEFVLLVQIGDHVFAQFPALRSLARLVTVGTATVFSIAFILPPLFEVRPSEIAIYDFVKRSAVTKALIILVLVVLARSFRVGLGRNIGGMALGLMACLGINTANFALVERLGWESYGDVFVVVGPVSQTLMVLIWAASLWRLDPVRVPAAKLTAVSSKSLEPLTDRLDEYNTRLDRLLRR
jgi:hypothetical protein